MAVARVVSGRLAARATGCPADVRTRDFLSRCRLTTTDSSLAVVLGRNYTCHGPRESGATSGVSRFLPPKLDIDTAYIDIPANSTLRITCHGKYPLAWSLPPQGDNVSLRSSIYDEEVDGIRPFKSVFELSTTDVMDLGRYICYYNGTTDLTKSGNATSVYVFVNDDYYLFQPHKEKDRNVSLWKNENEPKEVKLKEHGVEFDPMRGFIIHDPDSYYSGLFICNGSVPGRVYRVSSIPVNFKYMRRVQTAPEVKISKENNFHPVLNHSFTLNCTVTVKERIMTRVIWDYPNKNSSRIEMTYNRQHKPPGQVVVTSQLTVRDVQRSDEGVYTCSCVVRGGNKRNHSVFVSVYGKGFKTGLDASDPKLP
ncbi:hypothetical protein MTO96_048244 [Rhipicephalus appendiculatus]